VMYGKSNGNSHEADVSYLRTDRHERFAGR
jgi:hypothetical protein